LTAGLTAITHTGGTATPLPLLTMLKTQRHTQKKKYKVSMEHNIHSGAKPLLTVI